jgi:hypothetical protein
MSHTEEEIGRARSNRIAVLIALLVVWPVAYIVFVAGPLDGTGGRRVPQLLLYALHFFAIFVAPFWVFRRLDRRLWLKDRMPAMENQPGVVGVRKLEYTKRGRQISGLAAFREFEAMDLPKEFVSPGMGFVFDAPANWVATGDEKVFQITEQGTGTQISASGYENPGVDDEQWAGLRFAIVDQSMPFLSRASEPYGAAGHEWKGYACDWEGVFPEGTGETMKYVVMAVLVQEKAFSITLLTRKALFEEKRLFYLWLIQGSLTFYSVQKTTVH